jgi:quercetin dioxygenase-like cupin family protein
MILNADRLADLLAALADAIACDRGRKDEVGREIERVGRRLRPVIGARPALALPVQRHLTVDLSPAVAATAACFPHLAAALAPIVEDLPWRHGYAPRADLPDIENSMGWAEIVGPAAPFVSHDVCLGLTFIAPGIVYPSHSHPAVELYRIVCGRPLWTVGGRTRRRGPGEGILHQSCVAHAMNSDAEALLAIYSWTGDVVTASAWS